MSAILAQRLPIHSLHIVRRGHLVFDACFHPFERGELHGIASVTKSVTTTLIGLALERGMFPGLEMPRGHSAMTRREHRVRTDPDSPRQLLVGGDRRSIDRSNEALAQLRAEPARVADLVRLVQDSDGLVVMRAVDPMEKLAHEHPE